ncbi:hypothetical protein DH2020_035525 [Rehmannia glutinosa]|uniref:Thioredoxin domain-containing protein n=1 Tax=Rehmannia glutinosa TaxID=99300 RepID=A0ABR0V9L9_REHGL
MAVVYGAGLVLFLLLGRLTCADPVRVPSPPAVCPLISVKDIIFASRSDLLLESANPFPNEFQSPVPSGDEVSLQKALNIIHKNEHDYVALLFYSSWCPFSGPFRPSFSLLSSIFPSIPHFAIEESAVRPSILSKYGVHGFPTLILLNSTMRMRYQGSRTLDSLISFYEEFTGIKVSADGVSIDKIGCSGYDEKHENHQETCPFPWARSPKNFSLKEPFKKSNLQEGAKNAKAWASKSLATVSFGDASSSRDASRAMYERCFQALVGLSFLPVGGRQYLTSTC